MMQIIAEFLPQTSSLLGPECNKVECNFPGLIELSESFALSEEKGKVFWLRVESGQRREEGVKMASEKG